MKILNIRIQNLNSLKGEHYVDLAAEPLSCAGLFAITGPTGAGKSTIAKILYARFLEIGDRPVTLLDGDIVRQNLSNELSFSQGTPGYQCPAYRLCSR